MDPGTAIGVRFDGEGSFHEFHALLHTDQSEATAFSCGLVVEARAGISDGEMHGSRRSPQARFEAPYAAVFCRIVESFLEHSKQTKRNV